MAKDILENDIFEALANSSDKSYMYVTDMETGMTRWSKAAVDFFDLPSEYIDNILDVWGKKVHPDDLGPYLEDINSVLSGQKQRHEAQYRVLNKLGKYIWVECQGSIILGENNEPKVFAGVVVCLDNRNKYDALTGVYTTHEFYNRNIDGEEGFFVLIGMDNFRETISSYGYTVADSVLVEVARILEKQTGEMDRIYRFAGDEFLIVYSGLSRREVEAKYYDLKRVCSNIVTASHHHISSSISGGAVQFPQEGKDIEDYINDLENSLDSAKKTDRGNLVFYSEDIAKAQRRKKLLRDDLAVSIQNDYKGFELYYQPLVGAKDGHIIGCEALLRWTGENIKDSYPGEFIKALEDDGSIKEVGFFVMKSAIRQLRQWEDRFGDIKLSFNISYQQFMEQGFVDNLLAEVRTSGVNPRNLLCELTESSKIDNPKTLAKMFQRIRNAGISIALDDFGTAYASMEMLKVLPADIIKIEHMFVSNLEEQGHEIDFAIIENILSLAKKLNLASVVEGVETPAVEGIVKTLHPTYLQGYYYSKPVCKAEFEEMLRKDRNM